MEESSPGPRKRPDRKEKFLERKTKRQTVVKRCLQKAIRDVDNKSIILSELNKRVESCSRRTHLASIAINLLVYEAYEHQTPVPEIWNETFVRQVLVGTKEAKKPIELITNLFQRYPRLVYDVNDRHTGDGNIYTHAAKRFVVNIKNHLSINTMKMLKKLVYSSLTNKEQAVLALYAINGWKRSPKAKKTDPEMTNETITLVKECRNVLHLEEGEEMGKQFFKVKYKEMMDFRVFAIHKLKPLINKQYSFLPICRIKPHFITLDTMGFWGLCKDIGLIDCSLVSDEFNSIVEDHWKSVFHITQTEGKHCKFTGTIDTDGIAINIHYERPLCPTSEEIVIDPKLHRIVGNDPGRVNIFYMAEELEDGSYRYYKLTRSQYYRESGAKDAIEKTNRWHTGIQNELQRLSESSPKCTTLKDFLAYIDVVLDVKDALWTEYLKPRWARQRLRLYGGKKRVFSNFFNRVDKDTPVGSRLVVSYGSAGFAPGGKGEVSVPVGRAYNECRNRFITMYVDEFRTSRVYYQDGQTLLEAVGRFKGYKKTQIRGLLWCPTTSIFGSKLVNRDLNAALNIRRCLTDRPASLTRMRDQTRLSPPNIRRILRH